MLFYPTKLEIFGEKIQTQNLGWHLNYLPKLVQNKGGLGSTGTFNWGGYFNTQYFADPQENIIGIIMKQTQGPVNDETGWKFRQMIYQTIDD